MEVGGVNLAIAFLAGLVSCISPCVLPLAPLYLSNLVGGSVSPSGILDRRAPLLHALAFMTGLLALFLVLGVSVGLVGYFLRDRLPLVQKAGGAFLILMGLHVSRIVEMPALYRGLNLDLSSSRPAGCARSFLAGSSISAAWLPCIGPTLGSILTLALASGTVFQGGVLLLVYSLGLAVPFLSIGAALTRLPRVLRWLNGHHHGVAFVSGVVMIAMGIVVFTGSLQRLNAYFNLSGSGLGARI